MKSVVEGKVKASVYKYLREEPEESLKFSNAIRNQNESGILFYAACLAAVASGGRFAVDDRRLPGRSLSRRSST